MIESPLTDPWASDVDENRRWIESGGKEGAAAHWFGDDLTSRDLRGAVLAEAKLIECVFTNAILDRADLSYAFAGGARFDRARLAEATLVKAELSGASFVGAVAPRARFAKATLDRARFENADLRGANFEQAYLQGAHFTGAQLGNATFWKAVLDGADLSRTELGGVRFSDTQINTATRFDGATGIQDAIVESIMVGGTRLSGEDARSWLKAQAVRPTWSVEDLELWLLSKMSGELVSKALLELHVTESEMRRKALQLGAVFDQPGHAAAEYARVLGAPNATTPSSEGGVFAGSLRHEYSLPMWPDVTFVVNEHPTGYAWSVGFHCGPVSLPTDISRVQPWQWSASRLRDLAASTEVIEQWTYDLEAILTFATGVCFRARFDFELLQHWEASP